MPRAKFMIMFFDLLATWKGYASASTDRDEHSGYAERRRKRSTVQTETIQVPMTKLNGLSSKLHADFFYSSDELTWGKLSADDPSAIASFFRSLLLPLSGMSMLPEILKTIVKNEGPPDDAEDDLDDPGEGVLKHSEIQKVVETHHARLVDAAELVKAEACPLFVGAGAYQG